MARIRTVKPGLFRHEKLYKLERDSGLPVRFAFAGLFTAADREGRFKWRPGELKLDVLPYDHDVDFSRVLDALASRGFLQKYEVDGEEFGCIPTWRLHQVINNRESKSNIPPPTASGARIIEVLSDFTDVSTRGPRVEDATGTRLVQDRGEGKGREKEGKRKGTVASSDASVVALAPTPEKSSGPHELVEHWKAAFRARYQEQPHAMPKDYASAKNLLKAMGIEHAKLLVTAYFEMNDGWFQTKRHDLATLLGSVNAVQIYLGTGQTLSRLQIQQHEKADATIDQLRRIEKGLV